MKWNTPFTRAFPCKVPIMGAPMAGASGAKLAAETCRAGGLGFIAAGHLNSKESFKNLEREINAFNEMTDESTPLALGFISHSTFADEAGWNLFENVLEDYQPDVVQFFAPAISYIESEQRHTDVVKLSHSYGCKVIAQVGCVQDGIEALDAGVDCVIAQGSEAGGHGVRRELGTGTLSLTSSLVKLSHSRKNPVPILAAGGITDGKDLAAVLALGGDGVSIGTRLWASSEALGPTEFKDALVAAKSADDVIRTRSFDAIWNTYRKTKWPAPFDSSGALRNEITDELDGGVSDFEENPDKAIIAEFQKASAQNDPNFACVFSGKGVGKISSIEPTSDIIGRIEQEAKDAIRGLQETVIES